jgi:uncharacterized protein
MIIRVDDIKQDGLVLDLEENPEIFPVLDELIDSEAVRFTRPLALHLCARRVDDMVTVDGELRTVIVLECSRCLKKFEYKVQVSFALVYVHESPVVEDEQDGSEVELEAEEMGLIGYQGEEIDLTAALQEQVVMVLPYKPLCKADCRGLCPQCGADLNEGECGCGPRDFHGQFAALKGFSVKKK